MFLHYSSMSPIFVENVYFESEYKRLKPNVFYSQSSKILCGLKRSAEIKPIINSGHVTSPALCLISPQRWSWTKSVLGRKIDQS